MPKLDVVGVYEIARLLNVHRVTVMKWKQEDSFPVPDAVLAMGPVWRTSTIVKWDRDRRTT